MPITMIAPSALPFIQGFILSASIIVALGPQNLFLLRNGLCGKNMFCAVLISTLAQIVLVSLGIGGLSAIISTNPMVQVIATVGGILFLIVYGGRSLINVFRSAAATSETATISQISNATATSIPATILAALTFSFLNPASYVDTLMVIGSKSLFFAGDQRIIFGIGAVLASAVWYFILTYGASRLAPLFRSKQSWRVLDVVSGCIMIGTAVTMVAGWLMPSL
jgi:L-lysine exporter family protein LysE/ArgO